MEDVPRPKRFAVIYEMAGKYPVRLLCDLAGVSTSGYYKWVKRQKSPSEKQLEDEGLKHNIKIMGASPQTPSQPHTPKQGESEKRKVKKSL